MDSTPSQLQTPLSVSALWHSTFCPTKITLHTYNTNLTTAVHYPESQDNAMDTQSRSSAEVRN